MTAMTTFDQHKSKAALTISLLLTMADSIDSSDGSEDYDAYNAETFNVDIPEEEWEFGGSDEELNLPPVENELHEVISKESNHSASVPVNKDAPQRPFRDDNINLSIVESIEHLVDEDEDRREFNKTSIPPIYSSGERSFIASVGGSQFRDLPKSSSFWEGNSPFAMHSQRYLKPELGFSSDLPAGREANLLKGVKTLAQVEQELLSPNVSDIQKKDEMPDMFLHPNSAFGIHHENNMNALTENQRPPFNNEQDIKQYRGSSIQKLPSYPHARNAPFGPEALSRWQMNSLMFGRAMPPLHRPGYAPVNRPMMQQPFMPPHYMPPFRGMPPFVHHPVMRMPNSRPFWPGMDSPARCLPNVRRAQKNDRDLIMMTRTEQCLVHNILKSSIEFKNPEDEDYYYLNYCKKKGCNATESSQFEEGSGSNRKDYSPPDFEGVLGKLRMQPISAAAPRLMFNISSALNMKDGMLCDDSFKGTLKNSLRNLLIYIENLIILFKQATEVLIPEEGEKAMEILKENMSDCQVLVPLLMISKGQRLFNCYLKIYANNFLDLVDYFHSMHQSLLFKHNFDEKEFTAMLVTIRNCANGTKVDASDEDRIFEMFKYFYNMQPFNSWQKNRFYYFIFIHLLLYIPKLANLDAQKCRIFLIFCQNVLSARCPLTKEDFTALGFQSVESILTPAMDFMAKRLN
ncbi:hypothetical protein T12_7795 [Trichinella patagoniensis]|uniref:Uncharacterized protein n=1 Tax=Trichinella patagoniensis TaxID=990121 RepID=A0A0V0ZKB6_9BILA|nr:hypothetical protein T12_7795 [Trichinella patagoniensis]